MGSLHLSRKMETTPLALAYGLIIIGAVLIIAAALFPLKILCDWIDWNFNNGSRDSLYGVFMWFGISFWFLPFLLLGTGFIVSGILCFTGPLIGIIISTSVTSVLLLVSTVIAAIDVKKTGPGFGLIGIGVGIVGL